MQAVDVMTASVVAVPARASLPEVVRLLQRHRLRAVPVVDEAGCIVGMVSADDLRGLPVFDGSPDLPPSAHPAWLTETLTAADVMTAPVVCVHVDTDIRQVARLMIERDLTWVLVLRHGRLAGIVTSTDLLRALACCGIGRTNRRTVAAAENWLTLPSPQAVPSPPRRRAGPLAPWWTAGVEPDAPTAQHARLGFRLN